MFNILTSPIPSSGATKTASVRTARPTLRPVSIDFRKSPVSSCIIFADSLAMVIEADSRSMVSKRSLNRSSIWIGLLSSSGLRYLSSKRTVLLARSFALGISTSVLKSIPLDLASFAILYTRSVSASIRSRYVAYSADKRPVSLVGPNAYTTPINPEVNHMRARRPNNIRDEFVETRPRFID